MNGPMPAWRRCLAGQASSATVSSRRACSPKSRPGSWSRAGKDVVQGCAVERALGDGRVIVDAARLAAHAAVRVLVDIIGCRVAADLSKAWLASASARRLEAQRPQLSLRHLVLRCVQRRHCCSEVTVARNLNASGWNSGDLRNELWRFAQNGVGSADRSRLKCMVVSCIPFGV